MDYHTSLFHDQGISFDRYENIGEKSIFLESLLKKDRIQFFFGLEGKTNLHFGPYIRNIDEQNITFLFNPLQEHIFKIEIQPQTKLITLFIPLEKLHKLFTPEDLPILHNEAIQQKIYQDKLMSQSVLLTLLPLYRIQLNKSIEHTYYYGKMLEVVSLYFSDKEADNISCPFLNDANVLSKIKQAKEVLIQQLKLPPTIAELARMVTIPEYQLKSGFKELYGHTIYGYLLIKKMEQGRKLLDQGSIQVNEVAYDLGYSNPSHFITAFKKQYGLTPKKYLQGK
ncbi:MAG: AraC family transcriptional regulator [Saprospiraceae bacterium]